MKKEILHIYRRVSTKEQSEKYSLQDQLNLGIEKSKSLKLDYKDWCEGGVSGSSENIEDRDVLTDLFSEIEFGNVKHLYVYDLSRLSRNPMVSSQLRNQLQLQNVKLYTNESQIDFQKDEEILMYDFFSSINHFFVRVQSKKSKIGKVSHFKKGGWKGGPFPFGYTSVKLNGVKSLVVDDNQSEWVRKIFTWFLDGVSIIDICKKLDKKSVKPPSSSFWNNTTLSKILRNERYIGRDKMKDTTSNSKNPPILIYEDERLRIIDDITFYKVQRELDLTLKKKNQLTKVVHDEVLLRGLIFCGECGEIYGSRVKHSKSEYYYYCRSKENNWRKIHESKKVKCSVKKSININNTDRLVWETLIKILSDSHFIKEGIKEQVLSVKTKDEDNRLSKILEIKKKKKYVVSKISELESREKENRGWYLGGEIEGNEFEKNKEIIQNKKSERFNELEMLNSEINSLENQKKWIDWLGKHQKWIDDMKSNYSFDEKKEIINEYIQRIVVHFDKEMNQHKLQIELKFPIINDKYERLGTRRYKLHDGKSLIWKELPETKKGRKKKDELTLYNKVSNIIPPIKDTQSR